MIDTAVVGASGYAGAELVSLLARHPEVDLRSIHADSSAGKRFEDIHPGRAHDYSGPLLPFDAAALAGLDVVFLAQPSGASARAAAALRGKVGRIINLSGDLRLADAASYRRWYGEDHPAPELLGTAAYGLPELFRDGLPGATLIACAGCYATVAQLAAAPALALGAATTAADIVVAAMSGTTGAGRKANLALSFSEVGANLRAYRVGRHQHTPEIAQGLSRISGRAIGVTFVPHLVPIARGIFATVVVRLTGTLSQTDALAAYRAFYADSTLVRVIDAGVRLPQVSDVTGTAFCDLAPVLDEEAGTLVVLGVIDNLGKGAASQAVQVMNIACGLPEWTGLVCFPKEVLTHG